MEELGFFIDRTGKLTKFGKIAEDQQNKTRKNIHDYSFYDKIESTDYFKSLNLSYNEDSGLYGKLIDFSLQGIISGTQSSDGSMEHLIMYVPSSITSVQKDTLSSLCKELDGYLNYHIAVYHDLEDYSKYDNFDDLFNNLNVSDGLKR